jgi:hypothetical protein
MAARLVCSGWRHGTAWCCSLEMQLDPSTRQLTGHLPNGTLHSESPPDLLTERNTERNAERAA